MGRSCADPITQSFGCSSTRVTNAFSVPARLEKALAVFLDMAALERLVEVSAHTAATSSRTAKVRLLAQYLKSLTGDEIAIGVSFLIGEPRQGKLGAGYALLSAAMDRPGSASSSLTLQDVDRRLATFRDARGAGSAARRTELLGDLFSRATPAERDFLARMMTGELRQGALGGVMVDAIAAASGVSIAEARRAVMYGDLAHVATAGLTGGSAGLARFQLDTLKPVAPMLARTANDVAEALAEFGEAAVEWKVDGARVRVHKKDEDVRVFTRNLNDVTVAVPEIVDAVRAIPSRELVLDGEAIALDAHGAPRPFQVTMRRFGRRLDVEAMRESLPLSAFFFDILRSDADGLADRPAHERFDAMSQLLPQALIVPRLITSRVADAEAFVKAALTRGHEGVMVKALDSPYAAGSRGASWLKVKSARTLDLVVLAAEWGHGRRKGWLSNLHLGARDADGGFVMLGKTFKGMTDAMLAWQTEALLQREISRDTWTVYVRPELIVEVAFNGIQASSQYPGGLTLRFARVKRHRPDKRPQDAETIDTLRALHTSRPVRSAGL